MQYSFIIIMQVLLFCLLCSKFFYDFQFLLFFMVLKMKYFHFSVALLWVIQKIKRRCILFLDGSGIFKKSFSFILKAETDRHVGNSFRHQFSFQISVSSGFGGSDIGGMDERSFTVCLSLSFSLLFKKKNQSIQIILIN